MVMFMILAIHMVDKIILPSVVITVSIDDLTTFEKRPPPGPFTQPKRPSGASASVVQLLEVCFFFV